MRTVFVGDISPTADNRHLFAAGDVAALFSDTLSLFDGDVCMANLECALTESDEAIAKIGPALKAPLQTAETLRRAGITHCGLSNNHFFDYGRRGAQDSLAALHAAGIVTTGFGEDLQDARRDLVIEKNGEQLCVIAVCEHEYSYAMEQRMGARPFDEFETPLDIRAAKEKYARVVVLYHGGKEQCRYPSPRLRRACHAMAKSGADMILCQHSHCIGCYEQLAGCHILYGQGNFHFVKAGCDDIPGWNEGLAVRYDTQTGELELVAVVTNGHNAIRLATPDERAEIMGAFEKRNEMLQNGLWRAQWRAFCESNREQYTRAARKACVEEFGEDAVQKFAHYLDCEAHTDVWRELFRTYHAMGGEKK